MARHARKSRNGKHVQRCVSHKFKVIFPSEQAAQQASDELCGIGFFYDVYRCPVSRSGHHHLATHDYDKV